MTQQFFDHTKDCLKWCIDHPGQRCRDGQGREIWFVFEHENYPNLQFCTNVDASGNPLQTWFNLFPNDLKHFDLATLHPVEPEPVSIEPPKPTLGNLAALENWDWMTIHYPDKPIEHFKAQNGTWAYHYPQLKLALELGWPVDFGRCEA